MVKKNPIRWQTLWKYLLLSLCFLITLPGCDLGDVAEPSPTVPFTEYPTHTVVLMPDLAIRSITLAGDPSLACPSPDQTYQIDVKIENKGNTAAGPFVVQLDIDQQLVNSQLQPGEIVDIYFPKYEPNARAIVDVTSLVVESDESNNQSYYRLDLPTLAPECVATPTPEISEQESFAVLEGHSAKVWDLDFSPDGKTLASGSVDDTLRLWNVNPPRLLRTMQGHPFPVLLLKFSLNGSTLFTGSTDGILRQWQVSNGRLIQTYEGHSGWITGLDISRDGRWLASSADDSTVRLWRLPSGAVVHLIDEGMSGVRSIVFTPDSFALAWGEVDGTIRVRTISGVWLNSLKNGSRPVMSLAISPDGNYLAAGSTDGVIRIWLIKDGELLQTLGGHSDSVTDLAFSPSGEWLVSASKDQTLRLWKFDGTKFLTLPAQVLIGHSSPVDCVDFSPQGTMIASGSDDGSILLWAAP